MKSDEIKKVKWDNILHFNEIKNYLYNESLLVLSESCKKLKNSIFPSSVYDLYFSNFFKNSELKSFKISSTIINIICVNPFNLTDNKVLKDIELFDDKLKTIQNSFKKLIIKDQVDYLYSYNLIDKFDKVTNLHLNNCIVTFDLLQYMLNNLKLTQLSIRVVSAISNKPNSSVILPQNLVKFEYSLCSLILTQCDNTPVEIEPGYSQSNTPLLIEPQHIQSLKYLDYDDYENNPIKFGRILALNPQVTYINAFPYSLSEANLLIIQSNNQLINLEIQTEYSGSFETNNFPIIKSLKSLEVTAYEDGESPLNFITSCPNLIKLKLNIEILQNIKNGMNFALNLQKLKYLILESDQLVLFESLIVLPIIESLDVIEFCNFYIENIEFNQLNNFPKLRKIKFYGDSVGDSKQPFHSKIEIKGKWKVTYFYDSIIYNKA